MNNFAVGDRVIWTSQSKGYTTTKHGVVIAIIPAGTDPAQCVTDGYSMGFGSPRSHESYLVKVGRRWKPYWPLVAHLKKEA